MEDTVLEKDQTAKLSLSCRNNSTASVENVEAKLVQITRWYAGGRANEQQRILKAMSFDTQGLDRKVKMLERGQSEREDQIQILKELRRGVNSYHVAWRI
jgi:hypothetical protein